MKFCNCASCGRELVGRKWAKEAIDLEIPCVYGHILDRPYCLTCLELHQPPPGRYGPHDDTSPAWDNYIRTLEEN